MLRGWFKHGLITLLGVIVFLWLIKAEIVSFYLHHKIRVPISIGWLNTTFSHAIFRDFRIHNPKDFHHSSALYVRDLKMFYRFSELFKDPLVIDEIRMKDVFLDIELLNQSGSENNWTEISRQMKPSKENKGVVLRKLILDGLTVEISGPSLIGGRVRKEVDHLEFDHMNSQKGFPTEQLIHKIFGGAGVEEYIENAFNPGELIEGVINPIREL